MNIKVILDLIEKIEHAANTAETPVFPWFLAMLEGLRNQLKLYDEADIAENVLPYAVLDNLAQFYFRCEPLNNPNLNLDAEVLGELKKLNAFNSECMRQKVESEAKILALTSLVDFKQLVSPFLKRLDDLPAVKTLSDLDCKELGKINHRLDALKWRVGNSDHLYAVDSIESITRAAFNLFYRNQLTVLKQAERQEFVGLMKRFLKQYLTLDDLHPSEVLHDTTLDAVIDNAVISLAGWVGHSRTIVSTPWNIERTPGPAVALVLSPMGKERLKDMIEELNAIIPADAVIACDVIQKVKRDKTKVCVQYLVNEKRLVEVVARLRTKPLVEDEKQPAPRTQFGSLEPTVADKADAKSGDRPAGAGSASVLSLGLWGNVFAYPSSAGASLSTVAVNVEKQQTPVSTPALFQPVQTPAVVSVAEVQVASSEQSTQKSLAQ